MDIIDYKGTNYELERLDSTSGEYKLIKEFFDITYCSKNTLTTAQLPYM